MIKHGNTVFSSRSELFAHMAMKRAGETMRHYHPVVNIIGICLSAHSSRLVLIAKQSCKVDERNGWWKSWYLHIKMPFLLWVAIFNQAYPASCVWVSSTVENSLVRSAAKHRKEPLSEVFIWAVHILSHQWKYSSFGANELSGKWKMSKQNIPKGMGAGINSA